MAHGVVPHVQTGHFNRLHYDKGSLDDAPPVDQVSRRGGGAHGSREEVRRREAVLGRALGGQVSVIDTCRGAGWSRSWFAELRAPGTSTSEGGFALQAPIARASGAPASAPLMDLIIDDAINYLTEGPRFIAAHLALLRLGSSSVFTRPGCRTR